MKEIKFRVKEVLNALTQCASVVNTKNPLPILGDFHIKTYRTENGDAQLIITTSDMETWLSMKAPLIDADDVSICISVELLKALKTLDDCDATISIDENKHNITCDYGKGHFKMPYENADEFPKSSADTGDTTDLLIESKCLLSAIEHVGFTTANDELRPILNGIHLDFHGDGMIAVSTDGHRLARYKDASIVGVDGKQITLSKKPSNILMPILNAYNDKVKLSFNDKSMSIACKDFKLVSRLVEGCYPNYESVIPQNNPIFVTISKNALTSAIKRVMSMGSKTSNCVALMFSNGQVIVKAEDLDFSTSAIECVTCDYSGADFQIGFKGDMLFEILRNIDDDDVVVELSEPTRAIIAYGKSTPRDTYLSLMMPMLIN